jgi:hypothetical protein
MLKYYNGINKYGGMIYYSYKPFIFVPKQLNVFLVLEVFGYNTTPLDYIYTLKS